MITTRIRRLNGDSPFEPHPDTRARTFAAFEQAYGNAANGFTEPTIKSFRYPSQQQSGQGVEDSPSSILQALGGDKDIGFGLQINGFDQGRQVQAYVKAMDARDKLVKGMKTQAREKALQLNKEAVATREGVDLRERDDRRYQQRMAEEEALRVKRARAAPPEQRAETSAAANGYERTWAHYNAAREDTLKRSGNRKRLRAESYRQERDKRARLDDGPRGNIATGTAPAGNSQRALVLGGLAARKKGRTADGAVAVDIEDPKQTTQSVAGDLPAEILKHIFTEVQRQMLESKLIPLPLQAVHVDRQHALINEGNGRFSQGELMSYKHVMCKQKMCEYKTVCKAWKLGAEQLYSHDYYLIGEKQVKAATENLLGVMPQLRGLLETPEQRLARLEEERREKLAKAAKIAAGLDVSHGPGAGGAGVDDADDGDLDLIDAFMEDEDGWPEVDPLEANRILGPHAPVAPRPNKSAQRDLYRWTPAANSAILRDRLERLLEAERREALHEFMNRDFDALRPEEVDAYTPINLTVCCTLETLSNLIHRLYWLTKMPNYRRGKHPWLRIHRLTILHSFAPESLEIIQFKYLLSGMEALVVDELCYEAYTGGHVLSLNSLDQIAARLARPMRDADYKRDPAQDLNPVRVVPINLSKETGDYLVQGSPYAEESEKTQLERYCKLHQTRGGLGVIKLYRGMRIPLAGDPWPDMDLPSPLSFHNRGKIPWKELNATAGAMLRGMLALWKHCLKKFEISAHWQDLREAMHQSINFGTLRQFDYHYVPLDTHSVVRSHRKRFRGSGDRSHRPLGAMKGLDNIVMWDLRDRVPKWKRRKMRRQARARGEEFHDPGRIENLVWNVHVPHELWTQQKNRDEFKGFGQKVPWRYNAKDELDAIVNFVLKKGETFNPPQGPLSEGLTQRDICRLMTSWVCTKRKMKLVGTAAKSGELVSITQGVYIDKAWLQAHMTNREHYRRWATSQEERRAEEAFNNCLNPRESQAAFNATCVPGEIVAIAMHHNAVESAALRGKFMPIQQFQQAVFSPAKIEEAERMVEILEAINTKLDILPVWRRLPLLENSQRNPQQVDHPAVSIRAKLRKGNSRGWQTVRQAYGALTQNRAMHAHIPQNLAHVFFHPNVPPPRETQRFPFGEEETTAELGGFKLMIGQLVRCYGAREVYRGMNWPIWHPGYPDVRVVVDQGGWRVDPRGGK